LSDRVKLTLASLTVLMLAFGLGFSLSVLIIAAIMATGLDLAKERFGEMPAFP
jgi:cytochrome c biogenesis protein CcdA